MTGERVSTETRSNAECEGSSSAGKQGRSSSFRCTPITLVGLAVCLVVVAVALGAGVVSAGDQLAVIAPADNEIDAEPGEEFEVDVLMRSRGGHGGTGVAELTLVAQYHPDYLEVTNIEGAGWLEQGNETDIVEEHRIAHEAGTALLEQRREPVDGGATGDGRVATVTVTVSEDAPPGVAEIDFGESAVILENDLPLAILDQAVTVSIDGGDDPVPAFDHPDPDDRETLEAAVVNDSSDEDVSGTDADDDAVAEPVPGFGVLVTLAGFATLLGTVALLARSRRTQ
ncbi:hypothetical protein [Natronosalvus amylolyticus]|uniref:hypothetical protein n=1 Tax=Natronosalvus amylolyticus TaxID=2961994 RepID=UPI0020C9E5D0|nr:hypothetical protein [Natronosalvus amylolyticus]